MEVAHEKKMTKYDTLRMEIEMKVLPIKIECRGYASIAKLGILLGWQWFMCSIPSLTIDIFSGLKFLLIVRAFAKKASKIRKNKHNTELQRTDPGTKVTSF